MNELTLTMRKVLEKARAYGTWFGTSHHSHAPVPARAQTLKALVKRGLLETRFAHNYSATGQPAGGYREYRYKQ